jgi:hypothetical protein
VSEFLFGVMKVRPTRVQARALVRIARRHYVMFIEADMAGIGYQCWFAAPRSYGAPFDDQLASRVADDVAELGPLGPMDPQPKRRIKSK